MVAAAIREPREPYRALASLPGKQTRTPRTGNGQPATSNNLPSEATLVWLWAGQRFPASALATRDGVPLRVLNPGRPGRGAGPDFRDALVTPATATVGPLRGDVELHVRASDFRAHGHQRDARYDGVVLHVVFEDDSAEDTLLACGRRVPVAALGPWVRRRAGEIERWLAGPRLWREPCCDAAARLGMPHVARTLDELGDRRFGERVAALGREIEGRGSGEALYRALLEGLGYGGEPLASLADALPWREIAARIEPLSGDQRIVTAEALLLCAAGLLAEAPQNPHERLLDSLWRDSKLAATRVVLGARASLRPANHPARRLAGLARLLARHNLRSLEPDGPARRLIAAWSVPADGYWLRFVAPGVAAGRALGALIGRSRAIELLVNAVLPWCAAQAQLLEDGERAAAVRALYRELPRPGRYGALALLETNLRDGATPLALDARRQQGLLALYKTECTQGGCGRCVFS
ncbi:MAG: DUF2851 family protein [Dehalococcoidia bacterium]